MILKKPLLIEIFIASAAVAVLHKIALTLFLYWTTPWFDILMHFLGGFTIGLIAGFAFFISGFVKIPRDHLLNAFIIIIGTVLIVGLVWELWEVFVGFTDVLNDEVDTIMDVVMDLIGASVAFLYIKKKLWINNETQE